MSLVNDAGLEKESETPTAPLGRVLVVDDEKNIRATVKMVLNSEGFRVDMAEDGDKADEILSTTPPDGIRNTDGVFSSTSAIGPCFISAAGYPSA